MEYDIALYRGFSTIDVLNIFANINYDKRAQLRFGYFRVPYTYELYKTATSASGASATSGRFTWRTTPAG